MGTQTDGPRNDVGNFLFSFVFFSLSRYIQHEFSYYKDEILLGGGGLYIKTYKKSFVFINSCSWYCIFGYMEFNYEIQM